jgi:hypothetical protein
MDLPYSLLVISPFFLHCPNCSTRNELGCNREEHGQKAQTGSIQPQLLPLAKSSHRCLFLEKELGEEAALSEKRIEHWNRSYRYTLRRKPNLSNGQK